VKGTAVRAWVTTVIDVLGLALVIAGVAMVYVPAALIVTGIALIAVGFAQSSPIIEPDE
jgi:hypothetical protein